MSARLNLAFSIVDLELLIELLGAAMDDIVGHVLMVEGPRNIGHYNAGLLNLLGPLNTPVLADESTHFKVSRLLKIDDHDRRTLVVPPRLIKEPKIKEYHKPKWQRR